MLTETEIHKMISCCKNPRDRAIVSILATSACRIGELGTLTWGQVRIEPDHLMLKVRKKTGKERTVPCDAESRMYLINYMEYEAIVNPKREELVFWVMHAGKRCIMQYHNMLRIVQAAANDAGIERKVGCHLFRHSAITNMIEKGMGETLIKQVGWGNTATSMIRVYAHPKEQIILDAVRAVWGVEAEPEKPRAKKKYGPILCSCGELNPPACTVLSKMWSRVIKRNSKG